MTGELFINGKDAFTEYGAVLADGALSTLMTPSPIKDFIKSKSRAQDGARIIVQSPKLDERSLTLPFHIIATTEQIFYTKYAKFCDEVLALGVINLSTKYQPTKEYKLIYEQCTQFTQFAQQMASFMLKVTEPNPADRTLSANANIINN